MKTKQVHRKLTPTFTSIKVFTGYSANFRQWRAEGTHCKFLHGYAISFEVVFGAEELDSRNWIFDFGGMKRARTKIHNLTPLKFFEWLFDHTTIIAESDPSLPLFKKMDKAGIIQLRILPEVGCERFAEYLYRLINEFLRVETDGKVFAKKVTVIENEKNSASYGE